MAKGLSPRIRVMAPAGAAVSASFNGVTKQGREVSEGVYDIDVDKLGPWVVSGDNGEGVVTATAEVGDVAMVEIGLDFVSRVLSENDLETISEVGAAGEGALYWSVGDTYPMTLNGTVGIKTYNAEAKYMFICHFNWLGQNGVYFMGFMDKDSGKVLGMCDAKYNIESHDGTKTFNLFHWETQSGSATCRNYGGWKGCDARYDILGSTNVAPSGYGAMVTTSRVGYDPENYDIMKSPVAGTLMAALESDLRQVMKPITIYTDNGVSTGNVAENVTASVDYIVLPAEFDILGAKGYANTNEAAQQEQLAYYALGNSKTPYNENDLSTAVDIWTRSRRVAYSYPMVRLEEGVTPNGPFSSYSYALIPILRVA